MVTTEGIGVAVRVNRRSPPHSGTRPSTQHVRIHMIATRREPGDLLVQKLLPFRAEQPNHLRKGLSPQWSLKTTAGRRP